MIKLIKSTFYRERATVKRLINFIHSAKQLSFGPECEKFEKNFSEYQGRKFCVFFNSGSSANLALIQALLNMGRIKKGDVAAFSALTWSTNVMPLIQLGLDAMPVDVDPRTLNVSSGTFLDFLDRHETKVVFLTHLLGFCDDVERIKTMCDKLGIILLEDTCESLGTVYKGKKLGNFGLASTFSFYVGHHMSTIEGGAVCTDDEELAQMLKIVRAHGWDRNLSLEQQQNIRSTHHHTPFYSRYTFYDLGYNLRPTEINGFLGNLQLKFIDEIIKKREKNFMQLAPPIYEKADRYVPIQFDHIDLVSNFAVPVICRSAEIKDALVAACDGIIEIRPIVGGNIAQQPFARKHFSPVAQKMHCPNAQLIHERGLYFGNNPELTAQEIRKILDIFSKS